MADIKTKDNAKGTIRTIDKAAVATQRMKQAYIATKEKAERSVNANSSSAEEYASDKLESGIDEVVHDGAYAFTTRMCEAGVNVKVIQDTLGHKDISTTLNIYTDVTKELRKSEFEGLDSYFKNEYNKVSV